MKLLVAFCPGLPSPSITNNCNLYWRLALFRTLQSRSTGAPLTACSSRFEQREYQGSTKGELLVHRHRAQSITKHHPIAIQCG